jgi:hypothetical protein
MASFASVFARLLFVGALLFGGISAALAEDDRVEALKEWYSLADKRTDFEVSDPTLLPRRLILAVENSNCRYKETIKEQPVRFTELGSRRLAIVFCFGVSFGSHEVFDLSNLQWPRLMEFPFFFAQAEGFGTTSQPGHITWEKETGIFQAILGSDQLPSFEVRHTYRFSEAFRNAAFVVVRVEVKQALSPDAWTALWEAPRWSFPSLTERPLTLPWQQK